MLTGPVTILKWSFVRDDLPLADTCRQIALALRDEIRSLQSAGIGMIQVDEPAIREGVPLRRADREAYLRWAVDSFRLATSAACDDTQIHSHMCYSEFGDILAAIAEMDSDVPSIETSRARQARRGREAAAAEPDPASIRPASDSRLAASCGSPETRTAPEVGDHRPGPLTDPIVSSWVYQSKLLRIRRRRRVDESWADGPADRVCGRHHSRAT